jgi:hypothetical protein
MKNRKATVQLTFPFPKDFTDDDIREHVEILLQGGLSDIEKRIVELSRETSTSESAIFFRKAHLKQLRSFQSRYKAALRTLTILQIKS